MSIHQWLLPSLLDHAPKLNIDNNLKRCPTNNFMVSFSVTIEKTCFYFFMKCLMSGFLSVNHCTLIQWLFTYRPSCRELLNIIFIFLAFLHIKQQGSIMRACLFTSVSRFLTFVSNQICVVNQIGFPHCS